LKCHFSLLEYEKLKFMLENREPKNIQPADVETAEICTIAGTEEKGLSALQEEQEGKPQAKTNEVTQAETEEPALQAAGDETADEEERIRQQEIREQLRREAELRARLLQREEQRAAEAAIAGHRAAELTVAEERAAGNITEAATNKEKEAEKEEAKDVLAEKELGKSECQRVKRLTTVSSLHGLEIACCCTAFYFDLDFLLQWAPYQTQAEDIFQSMVLQFFRVGRCKTFRTSWS
jgi:hypothetical protein